MGEAVIYAAVILALVAAVTIYRLQPFHFGRYRPGALIGTWNYSRWIWMGGKGVWSAKLFRFSELDSVIDHRPAKPIGSIRVRLRVEGDFRPSENPDREPLVSIMLERKDDNWLADARTQNYRWYSPATMLREGVVELDVPLEGWTNVWGQKDEAAFAATMANLGNIAIVFGHSSGRSHGVRGTGSITLEAFS